MMTDEEPKVDIKRRYTVIEAAKILGVSRSTIYNWINSRIFEPSDIGYRKYGQGILINALALSRLWYTEKRYELPHFADEPYIVTNVKSSKLKEVQKMGIDFNDVINFEALKTHKKRRT